jgi:hypothetical protein
MENYQTKALDNFVKLTKYDIYKYLIDVDSFFKLDYVKIKDWFSLLVSKPDSKAFKNLTNLLRESDVISTIIFNNKVLLSEMYYWDLVVMLDEIKTTLQSSNNLSRRLRSVRLNLSDYDVFDYTTKKYQTLEDVQNEKVSTDSSDDRWVDIALSNDLLEEDYNQSGGVDLILPYIRKNNARLESVCDNMVGDKLYGLDFKKKINFVNEDFEINSYIDTAKQSISILTDVKYGSVPEFKNLGVRTDLVVGGNMAIINSPVIKRQLYLLFNTDDSLIDFKVESITQNSDSVDFKFSVNTIRGLLIESEKTI